VRHAVDLLLDRRGYRLLDVAAASAPGKSGRDARWSAAYLREAGDRQGEQRDAAGEPCDEAIPSRRSAIDEELISAVRRFLPASRRSRRHIEQS